MNLFLFLILGHVFGDFYLQTNEMASNKSKHFLRHITIYTLILVMIYMLLNGSDFVFIFGGAVFLSHLIIDGFNRYVIINLHDKYNWIQVVVFLVDQISANVNHFFHRYGKQFFQEYGKEFFLTYGKQNFQG